MKRLKGLRSHFPHLDTNVAPTAGGRAVYCRSNLVHHFFAPLRESAKIWLLGKRIEGLALVESHGKRKRMSDQNESAKNDALLSYDFSEVECLIDWPCFHSSYQLDKSSHSFLTLSKDFFSKKCIIFTGPTSSISQCSVPIRSRWDLPITHSLKTHIFLSLTKWQ